MAILLNSLLKNLKFNCDGHPPPYQITEEMLHHHRTNQVDGQLAYYGMPWQVVSRLRQSHSVLNAYVVGLGTGTMACQFRETDHLSIVEIDKQVIDIANNPAYFTFLKDCPSHPQIIQADGLKALLGVANHSLDLVVMDAFSSDAIPVHLLTKEAFETYESKLTHNGVILVHISNRHVNLLPVLTGLATALDLILIQKQQNDDQSTGQLGSEWAVLTKNEVLVNELVSMANWRPVIDSRSILWSNDYSNVISLIRW